MKKPKRAFITGGAGFIGSNVVEELICRGYETTVYDNLSLGKYEFIKRFVDDGKCLFIKGDLLDFKTLSESMKQNDIVFHLAANSDIAKGEEFTDTDLKQGTLATYNVLEAMRLNGISEIIFSSSSAIYGDAGTKEIDENYGPLLPISLYGASKLAGEGLLTAFSHNYGIKVWIFRFANVVGDNSTHGAVHDFIERLIIDPKNLKILGDGKQAKPYIYVKDCVNGILFGYEKACEKVNFFNLGTSGATSVTKIADIVVEEMGLSDVKYHYTGGDRGWRSDIPQVRFNISKLTKLGWKAKYSSDMAVRIAAKAIIKQKKNFK